MVKKKNPAKDSESHERLKEENKVLRNILASYNALLKEGFSYSLDTFINSALRSAIKVTKGEAGSLMLYDEARHELFIKSATHLPQSVIRRQRIKLKSGIAGWVAYHKRPLLLNNLRQLPQFRLRRQKASIRSALSAPLLIGPRLLGVLNVQRRRSAHSFNNQDLNILTLYATQLAIAMENRRLFSLAHEEISVLSTLISLSANLSMTRDSEKIISLVTSAAEKITSARAATCFLLDHEKKEIRFAHATGPVSKKLKNIRLKVGEGIVGRVIGRGRSKIVAMPQRHPAFAGRIDELTRFKTQNILCVPIKTSRRIIGALEVLNRKSGLAFDQEDEKVLSALSNLAAVALENSRLYQRLRSRIDLANRELAQANLDLQSGQNRLNALLRSIPDGVLAVDAKLCLTDVNRTARTDLGLPRKIKAGSSMRRHLHGTKLEELLRECLKTRILVRDEFSLGEKKPRFFAAIVAPFRTEGRACAVAILHDITQLKELDQMKSDFLSLCSHELRTPLTSIGALSELMISKEYSRESIREYCTVINEESKRLTVLINNILDLSSIEAGTLRAHFTVLEPMEIISEEAEKAKYYSASHTIRIDLPRFLPAVYCDENFLRQILSNLLGNAVKYSPNADKALLKARANKENLQISVSDYGIGIRKKDLKAVFDKFYRVRSRDTEKISGTGLGLPVVRHLVSAMKGRIWVDSVLGKGSTFHFTVPLAKHGVED